MTLEAKKDNLIIYEDFDIIIVNKPAGILSHADKHEKNETISQWLKNSQHSLARRIGVISDPRAGIVQRLDRAVSGVMVVAKTQLALYFLQKSLKKRKFFNKKYLGVVKKCFPKKKLIFTFPLAKTKTRGVVSFLRGKSSYTSCKTKRKLRKGCLIECFTRSGRTHQIREHLSFSGFPIADDWHFQSKKKKKSEEILLLAKKITFLHPGDLTWYSFSVPLPQNFKKLIS